MSERQTENEKLLQEQLDVAVAALLHYNDFENWDDEVRDENILHQNTVYTNAGTDKGFGWEVARKALADIKNLSEGTNER